MTRRKLKISCTIASSIALFAIAMAITGWFDDHANPPPLFWLPIASGALGVAGLNLRRLHPGIAADIADWLFGRFRRYRRWRGGRWGCVNGLAFGKKWILLGLECRERADEEWGREAGNCDQ